MSKKIWRLTVRDEISAGHALRHYEGKCERLHGHNFAVELTVEGDKLTENVELLLDFKVLKRALKEELAALRPPQSLVGKHLPPHLPERGPPSGRR